MKPCTWQFPSHPDFQFFAWTMVGECSVCAQQGQDEAIETEYEHRRKNSKTCKKQFLANKKSRNIFGYFLLFWTPKNDYSYSRVKDTENYPKTDKNDQKCLPGKSKHQENMKFKEN